MSRTFRRKSKYKDSTHANVNGELQIGKQLSHKGKKKRDKQRRTSRRLKIKSQQDFADDLSDALKALEDEDTDNIVHEELKEQLGIHC